MLPDLYLILICSNHPCLKHIFKVQKVFGSDVYINCSETAKFDNFHVSIRDESFIIRCELWPGVGWGQESGTFLFESRSFSDPSQSHQRFFRHPPHPPPDR